MMTARHRSRLSVVLTFSLLVPCIATDQGPSDSPPTQSLESARIRINTGGSRVDHRGLLVDLTSRSAVLLIKGQRVEFDLGDVDRLDVKGNDRVWDGGLVGAVGGAVQAAITIALMKRDRHRQGPGPSARDIVRMTATSTSFCFLVGLGVDALHQGSTTIYAKERGWLSVGPPKAALGFRVSF